MGTIATRPTYNAGDYDDTTLTISSPGTYSGYALRQTTNNVGIVTVTTAGPVIIENNLFAARGIVIDCQVSDADITIRNNALFGLNRDTSSQGAYKAITIGNAKNVVIEHNYLEYWWGIDIRTFQGDGTANQRIYNRYNDMHQGQEFDAGIGNGLSHWIIWNFTSACANSEISWNRFTGTYGDGECEDTINMYGCKGTAGNKILIHNNLFMDALTRAGGSSSAFNIQMEDADYVEAYRNICTGGVGGGVTAYGGTPTHINFNNNRVVQTGWIRGTSTFMTAERINAHGLMLSGYAPGYQSGCTVDLTMNDNWSISQINQPAGGTKIMSNYANWDEGWACQDQGGNNGTSILGMAAATALALEDAEVATWEARVAAEPGIIVGIESLAGLNYIRGGGMRSRS